MIIVHYAKNYTKNDQMREENDKLFQIKRKWL